MVPLLFSLAISIPATGRVVLPAGVVELTEALAIPAGAHDLAIVGHPDGTVLRLAPGFTGRAALVCTGATNLRLAGFTIDGQRARVPNHTGLPPSDIPFASFYSRNGILADSVQGLAIQRVSFQNIWAFSVLVSRSRRVRLQHLNVTDSGSRDSANRNNTTGGVLLEEGTTDFEVRDSVFTRILGNGVWTHSRYESPRNSAGLIASNRFQEIARDAIQVGHATQVRVEDNTGVRIGYPFDAVDPQGIPVGIDTAGNVDRSAYTHNRFDEINGKCIDLDGFHDGQVAYNTCVNKGTAASYPHGQFAIAMNNANPDMRSVRITLEGNTIDGVKFGGIFLIGSHHTVAHNRMSRLNLAHCNENAALYNGCVAIPGEPDVLQAGIYVGARAERPAPSGGNVIRDNFISGYKMDTRCVLAAPGIQLKDNTIQDNVCKAEEPVHE